MLLFPYQEIASIKLRWTTELTGHAMADVLSYSQFIPYHKVIKLHICELVRISRHVLSAFFTPRYTHKIYSFDTAFRHINSPHNQ